MKKRDKKRRTFDMRNITRMDYVHTRAPSKTSHTIGWWVRFSRASNTVSKFFADTKFGGKRKALAEAKSFRDRMEPFCPRDRDFQKMLTVTQATLKKAPLRAAVR